MTISIIWLLPIAGVSFTLGIIVSLLWETRTKGIEIKPLKPPTETPSHFQIIASLYENRQLDYYNYFFVLENITPETEKVMSRLVAELTHGMRSEFNENFTPETCRKLGKMLRELDALVICEKPYEEQYKALQAELEKCLNIE